jgi:WhiB family redox-sensing transcriptional regulator
VTRQSADADWRLLGACRDHNPDLFFPSEDAPAELVRVQVATAKAVCRSCPVAGVCLSTALTRRWSYGVWGGLSAEDRKAVIASRTAVTTSPAQAPMQAAKPRRPRRRISRTNGVVRLPAVAVPPQPVAVSA